jgi:hypothetical protein
VTNAVESYLEGKEAEGRDIVDARWRAKAHIHPTPGDKQCAELTTEQIRKWHRDLVKTAPRLRTKPGKDRQYRLFMDDKDSERRRQASAKRVFAILKAALNHAFHNGKVPSDVAWRQGETVQRRRLGADQSPRVSEHRPTAAAEAMSAICPLADLISSRTARRGLARRYPTGQAWRNTGSISCRATPDRAPDTNPAPP